MPAAIDFDAWSAAFTGDWVRTNPLLATREQYFAGAEQDALDRELALALTYGSTFGCRMADRQAALARRGLAELAGFARDRLSAEQRVSAAALDWGLRDAVANAEFAQQRFVFRQLWGLHDSLIAFLADTHPVRRARDAENYLARLGQLAPCLDEGIAEAAAAERAGVIAPTFVLERVIEQLDALAAPPPAETVPVATFVERLRGVPELAPERVVRLVAAAAELVRDAVLPALGRVRTFLTAQLPRASAAAGAWTLPLGADYYARELASMTGTSLGPDEVHALGLREVTRIEAEMDEVLAELGFAHGSVDERVARVSERFRVPDDDAARAALVAEIQAVVDDAARRARAAFDLVPRAPAVVRREPAYSEKASAAHYQTPAPDGSSPGIYWIPLPSVDPLTPWLGVGLKSTAYHEAIPGHHFQLALQQESAALPHWRKRNAFGYNAAFNEGWALYAEFLCAEQGWYADDPVGRLGYLRLQLFRAKRLVVDTGLHARRWTRAEAIAYGMPPSEVERYVVMPGQACSYMVGQLHLYALRERARARLGAAFSLRAFHALVLSGGTLPLDVLTEVVDGWAGGTIGA